LGKPFVRCSSAQLAAGNNLHRNVIWRDNGAKAGLVEPFTTQPPLAVAFDLRGFVDRSLELLRLGRFWSSLPDGIDLQPPVAAVRPL
jgi:hypothetical protein